jgi:pyridoxine 5-phosphate synthase
VPDAPDAITSNAGWDTVKHRDFLSEVIAAFKGRGIRTSIFVDPNPDMVAAAVQTGTERIELYTEQYALDYAAGKQHAALKFSKAAEVANQHGLGVNAGHDLSLENIADFKKQVPHLLEVSIGHALICEAIYLGLENVVAMYLNRLR